VDFESPVWTLKRLCFLAFWNSYSCWYVGEMFIWNINYYRLSLAKSSASPVLSKEAHLKTNLCSSMKALHPRFKRRFLNIFT